MVKKIEGILSLADLSATKPFAWPALYAILLAAGLTGYLPYDQANFWLGIIAIVLYTRFPVAVKGGYRFLLATFVFLGLYLLLPVKTLFFSKLKSKYHKRNMEEVIVLPDCLGETNIFFLWV
jgi:hypothetical protein